MFFHFSELYYMIIIFFRIEITKVCTKMQNTKHFGRNLIRFRAYTRETRLLRSDSMARRAGSNGSNASSGLIKEERTFRPALPVFVIDNDDYSSSSLFHRLRITFSCVATQLTLSTLNLGLRCSTGCPMIHDESWNQLHQQNHPGQIQV